MPFSLLGYASSFRWAPAMIYRLLPRAQHLLMHFSSGPRARHLTLARYPIQRSRDALLLQLLFSIRISQRERLRDYCRLYVTHVTVYACEFSTSGLSDLCVCSRHLSRDNASEWKWSFRWPDQHTDRRNAVSFTLILESLEISNWIRHMEIHIIV